jgi:YesN/AraC family two-component response regulator
MNKLEMKLYEIQQHQEEHDHEYAQLVIPIDSSVFIQTKDADFIIDKKLIGFIPPNMSHKYNAKDGKKTLLLNIPTHLLKKKDSAKFSNTHYVARDDKLVLLVSLILNELETNPESPSLEYLFFFLYDKLVESKVYKSIDYISKNYLNDIHISELASIEHYNENYYREWFKKQMGVGPTLYIQKLRIEKAKELLVTTCYSITEIAAQVGYNHSSSFNRVFNQHEELNPKEYRNKHSSKT